MAYMHIDNLYRDQRVLQYKKLWATEKIHGTSAWITWRDNMITLHSGGGSSVVFKELFDLPFITVKFVELFGSKTVKLHGEFYGGKIQKMSHVYGKSDFIMFDIKVEDVFLSHDKVISLGKTFGIPVVESRIIDATLEEIDRIRALPSALAIWKGNGFHVREGIVLKPLEECVSNNGKRVIAKHKNDEYMETGTQRTVDPEALQRLEDGKAIALEWVVPNRFDHVIDHIMSGALQDLDRTHTKVVIDEMIADIRREGEEEIVWNQAVDRAIAAETRKLFFKWLDDQIGE